MDRSNLTTAGFARRSVRALPRRQAGLTLIELMVALVLGLLITAAAVAALIVARQGFTSVDESSQLRENARFAASLIQRISVQAGFVNVDRGDTSLPGGATGVHGWDNALLDTSLLPAQTADSRDTGCTVTDTSCVNGSDILAIRYIGVSRPPGSSTPDGSIINCAGQAEPDIAGTAAWSIFHVVRGASGEPSLVCTYLQSGVGGAWQSRALVQGVEGFQVLYGVDTLDAAGAAGKDTVADKFVRAADVTDWTIVRTLRIGLVVRGPVGSGPDKAGSAETIPVLGPGFSATADKGSNLTVAADGRLRQRLVFTVQLRNAQYEY